MTGEQLRKGIALAKAGKELEARSILGQIVRGDPRSVLGWLWLAGVVETKEQRCYCLEKVLQLDPQNEVVRQALTKIKSETEVPPSVPRVAPLERREARITKQQVAAGSQYFVGHQLASENTDAWRGVIASVFNPLGYEPYYADVGADKVIEGQSLLLKICQRIFSTSFGIFDLSSGDPNGYLELGIALGLNRPIIATAKEEASLPRVLGERYVIRYADHSDLAAKLPRLCDQDFPPTTQPVADYCYFCGRVCESMSTPPDENSYLVLHHSKLLWRGLMRSLGPHLAGYHLYPAYLTDRASGPMLCDMRRKVLASQFALCHLGALSNESSFLSLGMAVGSRAPCILLSKKGPVSVPSDLQGFDRIEYTTLADLEGRLTDTLGTFLGRIMSGSVGKNDKTAFLSLPFWVEFDNWIDRVTHDARAPDTIYGRMRVVQYRGQKRLAEHIVTERGLLFGRGSDCTVVVENQSVSSRHFRILKGRTGKYFVEDLHSKNGTFLNGTRLSPGKRVELRPNDTIRIPGARFLMWDDRPLPKEETAQTRRGAGLLSPILKVEIPDVPPPTYLSTWDHSLVLTAFHPDDRNRFAFEVQAYYPMGRILAELVDLLGLPKKSYRFMIGDRFIDDDETPLSIGMQEGDVLRIVLEESSRTTLRGFEW
jgi:hypothetical protein